MASAKTRRPAEPMLKRPQPAAIVPFAGPQASRLPGALELPLAHLLADPEQPRRDWSHDDGERQLTELAESIREFGILQPLLVAEIAEEGEGVPRYRIIAGNRRFLAAQRAGLLTVPAVVRTVEAAELRILQLTENLQRQDLAPLDEARAFQELLDLRGLTPPQLASRLHVSDQHVRNRLRLLDDQVLADAVERRQISASAARQIQQLPDPERDTFRARVRAGERPQTNDLAVVRARLAAAGVENPRRSPRPAPGTAVASSDLSPVKSPNSLDQPNGQKKVDTVPLGGGAEKPTNTPATTVESVRTEPDEHRQPGPRPFHVRMAAATAEARQLVLDALRHGSARAMSCAALLNELETGGTPDYPPAAAG